MIGAVNIGVFGVFLAMSCVMAFNDLDYSDLETLGMACSPRDNCNVPFNRTFSDTNCECDRKCGMYNDCCINAHRYSRLATLRIRGLMCLPEFSRQQGVYVIGKCSRNWNGPSLVRLKCEYSNDMSDPLMAAPTTDVETDITYKNRYCSECNYVPAPHLRSWIIRIECDSLMAANTSGNITEEYVRDHIIYKTTYPHRKKWGVFVWNKHRAQEVFHPCRLNFNVPETLEANVRLCRPGLVSTCTPTWRRNTVRRNCDKYMAVVFSETRAYKNAHCALCNHVNLSSLTCPTALISRRKPPMSFTILLDVNLNDGNRVGEINRCPDGQKYDSFFKKCRKLVCALPGYSMQGERCVKSK